MTDTISTHNPEPEGRSASTRSGPLRNGSTVTCGICQAVYAPVKVYEYLLQAPRVALESAFMSMCHFCFRCRRPACPSCWDYVHGVCGACALEARLPFRSPSTPLQGVIFPAIRQPGYKRVAQARLTCIHPGKFHTLAPIDSVETTLTDAIATEHTSHQIKMPGATPATTTQERTTIEQPGKQSPSTPLPAAPSTSVDIDEIVTQPERRRRPDIDKITAKPKRPHRVDIDQIVTRPERHRRPDIDQIATKPEPLNYTDDAEIVAQPVGHRRAHIDEIATKPGPHKNISTDELVTGSEHRSSRSIGRRIERVIISILLTLLVFIVVIVILACMFQNINTAILRITSLDIRVEVAYILLLIRQVFS